MTEFFLLKSFTPLGKEVQLKAAQAKSDDLHTGAALCVLGEQPSGPGKRSQLPAVASSLDDLDDFASHPEPLNFSSTQAFGRRAEVQLVGVMDCRCSPAARSCVSLGGTKERWVQTCEGWVLLQRLVAAI